MMIETTKRKKFYGNITSEINIKSLSKENEVFMKMIDSERRSGVNELKGLQSQDSNT